MRGTKAPRWRQHGAAGQQDNQSNPSQHAADIQSQNNVRRGSTRSYNGLAETAFGSAHRNMIAVRDNQKNPTIRLWRGELVTTCDAADLRAACPMQTYKTRPVAKNASVLRRSVARLLATT